MTPRRRGRRAFAGLALGAVLGTAAGCGGPSDGDRARQAARSYAVAVAGITSTAQTQLKEAARDADYADGAAASTSTRAYATSIRTTATALAATKPPAAVAADHAALLALYGGTADHLDTLAGQFAATGDPSTLAQLAQDLATELQAYAGREQELRSAIDAALAKTP